MKRWWAERGWLAKLCLFTWPVAVLGLALTQFLLPDFQQRPVAGCYWTDAMLPYVGCHNTGNDKVWSFLFTLPLNWLFFMWAAGPLAVFGLLSGNIAAIPTLFMWIFWIFSAWQLLTFVVTSLADVPSGSRL